MRDSLGSPDPVYTWSRTLPSYDVTFNANVVMCWERVFKFWTWPWITGSLQLLSALKTELSFTEGYIAWWDQKNIA